MATNPRHLRPELTCLNKVVHYFAESTKSDPVYCMQVGANDGKTNDPVHPCIIRYGWESILLEPDPHVFEHELKQTYAGCEHVRLENLAIAPEKGYRSFYRLAFSKARWATGLSSFNREHLERQVHKGYAASKAREHGDHLPANETDYIEKTKVRTDTFYGILSRHGFDRLDVLCIDTEGYDYEVLKSFDFSSLRPRLVLYESKDLSNEDFASSLKLLGSHGYRLFWQKGDTMAVTFKIPFLKQMMFKTEAFLEKL